VSPTAIAVIVLCAITLYLATIVHRYVWDRRQDAKSLKTLVDAISAPKSIIMLPSEPEVKNLVETIHDTAEQAKAVADTAIENADAAIENGHTQ
jgi:hypothetical protein